MIREISIHGNPNNIYFGSGMYSSDSGLFQISIQVPSSISRDNPTILDQEISLTQEGAAVLQQEGLASCDCGSQNCATTIRIENDIVTIRHGSTRHEISAPLPANFWSHIRLFTYDNEPEYMI